MTGEEANDITTQFDLLKILEIPYYKIPDKIWNNNYAARKELSLKISSIKGVKKSGALSNDFYIKFFLELPLDKAFITSKDCDEFGIREGYKLSLRRCSIILARATGRGSGDVVKFQENAPMLDVDKYGQIEIDGYIKAYIEKLRAMQKGAAESTLGNGI